MAKRRMPAAAPRSDDAAPAVETAAATPRFRLLAHLTDFYFSLDRRSLAVFRILLALLLIHGWFLRWPDIEAFYTENGVLPIATPLAKSGGDFHFSLLEAAGGLLLVRVLFVVGLAAHVGLLAGWRTRSCTILSLLFFASVRNRNPLVNAGYDEVQLHMLLWGVFLPLGDRFSIDSIRAALARGVDLANRPSSRGGPPLLTQRSLAALAVVLQLATIYFFAAWLKYGPSWRDGTALYYTLNLDLVATGFGEWLGRGPLLPLKAMAYGTLAVEWAAPVLILLPAPWPWFRRAAIAFLTAVHLGTAATMVLDSFPYAMISWYALLLRDDDWRFLSRWGLRASRRIVVYYDDTCGFCRRVCDLVSLADGAGFVRFEGAAAGRAAGLDAAELDTTIVAVDASGRKLVRARAVAAIARALPLPFHVFRAVVWLGPVGDALYDAVARNRHRISAAVGLAACGIDPPTAPRLAPAATNANWNRPVRRLAALTLQTGLFLSVAVETYNQSVIARTHAPRVAEPTWMAAVVGATGIVPGWFLFAPEPLHYDGWWILRGVTEVGEPIDPLTGRAPTFDKPKRVSRMVNTLWRQYLFKLSLTSHADERYYFGRYLARKDSERTPPGHRLERFDFIYARETTLPPGQPRPFPRSDVVLWSYDAKRRIVTKAEATAP